MRRLLLLVALSLVPLLAGAHEGHHAPARPQASPTAQANGVIVAIVAAPSRCPGGDELCCCHDLTCTPSYPPAAIADPGRREIAPAPVRAQLPQYAQAAPRAVALA